MTPLPFRFDIVARCGDDGGLIQVPVWHEDDMLDYAAQCVAAETDALRAELAKCGGNNCFGRRIGVATNWVTESARDAAVAEERERCIAAVEGNLDGSSYSLSPQIAALIVARIRGEQTP